MRKCLGISIVGVAMATMSGWSNVLAQTPALTGIVVADLDSKVKPCDNFYDYANGTWRAQNPIPASMDRWSRRWQAGEANKEQLKVILDDLSTKQEKAGTPAQLTGDFYAACTNIKSINGKGLKPIEAMLAEIDAMHDTTSLGAEISRLEAIGVPAPFFFFAAQDVHEPTQMIAEVGATGLGLPDRDYYLKPEKRFADARAGYLVYVAKILALAGAKPEEAKTGAETVMKLETALAKASLDNVALRDPHAVDHPMQVDALAKITPAFDWNAFFASAHVAKGKVNVDQPEFMAEVQRQLASTPIAAGKPIYGGSY